MKKFAEQFGPWALITGASSGMGAEFARRTAASGVNVVLVARREDRLCRLADELQEEFAVQARIVVTDLSESGFLDAVRNGHRRHRGRPACELRRLCNVWTLAG